MAVGQLPPVAVRQFYPPDYSALKTTIEDVNKKMNKTDFFESWLYPKLILPCSLHRAVWTGVYHSVGVLKITVKAVAWIKWDGGKVGDSLPRGFELHVIGTHAQKVAKSIFAIIVLALGFFDPKAAIEWLQWLGMGEEYTREGNHIPILPRPHYVPRSVQKKETPPLPPRRLFAVAPPASHASTLQPVELERRPPPVPKAGPPSWAKEADDAHKLSRSRSHSVSQASQNQAALSTQEAPPVPKAGPPSSAKEADDAQKLKRSRSHSVSQVSQNPAALSAQEAPPSPVAANPPYTDFRGSVSGFNKSTLRDSKKRVLPEIQDETKDPHTSLQDSIRDAVEARAPAIQGQGDGSDDEYSGSDWEI